MHWSTTNYVVLASVASGLIMYSLKTLKSPLSVPISVFKGNFDLHFRYRRHFKRLGVVFLIKLTDFPTISTYINISSSNFWKYHVPK